MRKGTLARVEIYAGLAAVAVMIALAGYSLVSALSERLDPKVRACIEHKLFAENPLLKLYYINQNCRYERGQKGGFHYE